MASKIFNDPIHGHIELPAICIRIIDTWQFQRLRDLKQIGVSFFVFPGATHCRFEHSIGTCYLAGLVLDHLESNQPELGITLRDRNCVLLAALCHDLGHGPFSHLFDGQFMKMKRDTSDPFEHEQASQEMFKELIMENDIFLDPNDVNFILDLIKGESKLSSGEKPFLFDIVANKRNSVDVDKFDYIMRDCYYVGIKTSIDSKRLVFSMRVIDDQICFNQKDSFTLYELFHTRYTLFKRVYTHRVSTAIEFMICDIFLEADPILKISEMVNDMKKYQLLNDSILNMIAMSTDPKLGKAQTILKNLKERKLYAFSDQVIIPFDRMLDITKQKINSEQICKFQTSGNLKEDDIIVEWLVLNYALSDKNPVDSIRFYHKSRPDLSHKISKGQVSNFLPDYYKEITIRIYARNASKKADIQEAFRNLLAHLNQQDENEFLSAESAYYIDKPTNNTPSVASRHSSPSKSRLVTNDALTLDSPLRKRVGSKRARCQSYNSEYND